MRRTKSCLILFVLLLIISCSPPTINVSKQTPPLPSPSGMLTITSTPPATGVFVDSKEAGTTTPLSLTLPAGEHRVELRRAFYKNLTTAVAIVPDQLNELAVDLISSLFPYTGAWENRGPTLSNEGDNLSILMNLAVIDDIVFGTDIFLINDFSGGTGNCLGQIDAMNHADILCAFGNHDNGYWRDVRYQITPKSMSQISIQTLFVDSNHRLFLTIVLDRKN